MPKETFYNLDIDKQDRITKAAMDEFASHTYNEAKLSRIIKAAKIPRGSFYQYFEDKADLYKHLFDVIVQEKLKYLGPELQNPSEMPFIELFRSLAQSGLQFANEHPEYIQITRNLMANRGQAIFKDVMGDNMEIGRQFYKSFIETDKKHGRIRDDVDTDLLADIIIETTTSLSFAELSSDKAFDIEAMLKRMEDFLYILQKGIE